MPDDNIPQNNVTTQDATADSAALGSLDNAVVEADEANVPDGVQAEEQVESQDKTNEIVRKIADAHNVLIALSSDPSVDELAAAIGLSIYLDKLGKRATAIYSGSTPNALEFLKPEETFESTADTLQDFVIALNKEKADHLRYKLDGDFVKVYITPYKTRIAESDLEFSYGDFNVDLVIALDVMNGIDLDTALREHGRIMHNAVIINITTGKPGKFGEIEWSEPKASSISEIAAKLSYMMSRDVPLEKEEATAFLTGIVAATNRFSNAKTFPDTMKLASKLMESGANQQLISKNITPDIDNELYASMSVGAGNVENDPTKLDINHGLEDTNEDKEVDTEVNDEQESTLLDDLKVAEAVLSGAGAEAIPDIEAAPVNVDEMTDAPMEDEVVENDSISDNTTASEDLASEAQNLGNDNEEEREIPGPQIPTPGASLPKIEKVIEPPKDLTDELLAQPEPNKYGQMLEDALREGDNIASVVAPEVVTEPEINDVPDMGYNEPVPTDGSGVNGEYVAPAENLPMPDAEILPPPPALEVDFGAMPAPVVEQPVESESVTPLEPVTPIAQPETSAEPAVISEPVMTSEPVVAPEPAVMPEPVVASELAAVPEPQPQSLGAQPVMQDQVYNNSANDPGAFKIPGM